MKYTLSNVEVIKTQTGKEYKRATLNTGDTVSVWPDVSFYAAVADGVEVEGEVKVNGKYKNLIGMPTRTSTGGFQRGGNIGKAQEKKAEYIEKAQDNKERAVRTASTMSGAVAIVCAFYKDRNLTETAIEAELVNWREKLWKHWEDMDIPF